MRIAVFPAATVPFIGIPEAHGEPLESTWVICTCQATEDKPPVLSRVILIPGRLVRLVEQVWALVLGLMKNDSLTGVGEGTGVVGEGAGVVGEGTTEGEGVAGLGERDVVGRAVGTGDLPTGVGV